MKASRGNARDHYGILRLLDRIYQLNSKPSFWESISLWKPINNCDNSTPLHHDFTVDFVNQIEQYDTYGDKHLPKNRKNALVAIWIGYVLSVPESTVLC